MATRKSKNHIEGQLSLESLWAEPEEVVATPSPSAATSPTGRHTNGANNRRSRRPRPARGAEARRTSSPLPGARSVILITRGPARREPFRNWLTTLQHERSTVSSQPPTSNWA